jgi:tetratricopeptide (TPR) repeat protein
MDLLLLLASRPHGVVTREEILEHLWPDVIVGDDALARAISKLRRALGDDPRAPRFIETIPKRGYRLIATAPAAGEAVPARRVSRRHGPRAGALAAAIAPLLVLAAWLVTSTPGSASAEARAVVERADDFYFQYSRADNEAAIALYERVLARHPDHARAHAGLANALVQDVIRWPEDAAAIEFTRLGDALEHGHTRSPAAQRLLERAQLHAQRAVDLAPDDAASHKALGFVHSAREEFELAIAHYERAVALDADAWGPLINIGDVLEISGRADEALTYFEAAYAAMTRVYDTQTTRIQPWYAELGVLIGDRHRAAGRLGDAKSWYRRVLDYAPLHPAATGRLAAVQSESGHADVARRLCDDLRRRMGPTAQCTQRDG